MVQNILCYEAFGCRQDPLLQMLPKHDTEYRIALNNGLNEYSGLTIDESGTKTV